jgi:uncharacterized membrane protein YfhO
MPNFYPARFSFLFSFVVIAMGYEGLKTPGLPKKRLIVFGAAFAAVTALLFHRLTAEYLAYKTIVFDAVVFLLTCGLLALGKRRRAVLLLLCLLQCAGLFVNAYYAYRRLSVLYTAAESAYTEETETVQALVNRVREEDGSLYRMEKNFHRNDNDPLLYGYNGVSHMSSDLDQAFLDFCRKLGLHQGNYHLAYRAGATPVLDSLLGVKYILREDGVAFEPLPDGYTALWTDGNVTAYENTYVLPFAYLVPGQTLELTGDDPFINQNLLLSDLTGTDAAVFWPVYDVQRTYDGTWETYTFPVAADRQLYMKSYGSAYTLNGDAVSAARMNGTVRLPLSGEDTAYTVQMTAPLGLYLAYFDPEAFEQAQAVLAAHGANVTSDTDSHLVITASVTDECTQLLITVPYDRGWRVWVDGEKSETTSRYGALLAVNLSQGEHTVELRFTPRGLWAGIGISALSLVVLVLWMNLRKRSSSRSKLQAP